MSDNLPVREAKRELRRIVNGRLRLLSHSEIAGASARIRDFLAERLANLPAGSNVMSYAAMAREVDLDALPERFPGLRWWLPAEKEDHIEARLLNGGLKIGTWRTRDPSPDNPVCDPENMDVILLPGLAFSPLSGGRLGRGRGHYDRFLARAGRAVLIAVGFDCQLENGVPLEPHDIPAHEVVSESGLVTILPPA